MLRSMNDVRGFTIGATDGDIGRVDAFYFDDTSFTVRHLVVDTGGWLTGRKVLISPRALRAIDWDGQRITAELTKSQVEQSPDVDTDQPVSRQQDVNYHRYYGYPYYWEGPYLWGLGPYPVTIPGGEATDDERRWEWGAEERGDPHLRSSGAVIGYHIEATDGDIGHVEDFLVEDSSWAIRYMVVDTRNWWPGKKVLVSPEWIQRVDWSDSKVHVGMTREQVSTSPEYDPLGPIARDYEALLHGHYGRPSYWERPAKATTAEEWTARSDRPVAAPLVHVQLSERLEQLKQEPTWR
ncbi:MAG TPA: PRC-barrel domain-containing protein, partial [Candidatus Binatia bacterium]|nr:PRC-barrel domain-containing protein [Candidatus Binatia bacterium]